jgi:hypothetical protein
MSDERQPGDEPEVDEETLRKETQELLADARDLLAAELLLKSADPLRRDLVADLLWYLRRTADYAAKLAVVLQRQEGNPETAEMVGAQLELMAESIRQIGPLRMDEEQEREDEE